jgi:AraC family transcriptional regulator
MQDEHASFSNVDRVAGNKAVINQLASVCGQHRSNGRLWDALSALIEAMNCVLKDEDENAKQYVRTACISLDAESIDEFPASLAVESHLPSSCRGGLAAWQVRRLTMYIDAHLGDTVRCEDLARLARLSLSHFIRAFRDSFGYPPHTFLTRRRLERAQGLMLTTDAPLGQIALDCGLADQSHLSRLFKQFVGETPAAWRRARVS